MDKITLSERTQFNPMFQPQILRSGNGLKVPLICMTPGQFIPPHPGGMGVFYIVKGKATMTIEGKDVMVSAGDMIFIEKGETRGIQAVEELTAFAVHVTG